MYRLLIALLLVSTSACQSKTEVQDGDIIFQTSKSAQSEAVQRATHSQYSHMGLILYRKGKPFVFEASGKARFTPLQQWIQRGKDGKYVVKRLQNASSVLNAAALAKLNATARRFVGKPYDLTFEWSDKRMYCSELVWKIYAEALGIKLGELQRLRDFDLSHPVVKRKLAERYGKRIPMDETVVSPEAIFQSPLLQTVD